ncbi:mechanosensitive ion channel family protein [Corynebacterium pseudotuberculosis]|nr:mechanosensitive ion channel domain-containing protein [Corynebacterium pseudotuberculosis]
MTTFSATEQTETVSSWLGSINTQEWLVERPIQIGVTILIGLIANWLLRKSITKAAQININKKPTKISSVLPLRGKANNKRPRRSAQRRQSRMLTLAAVGRSAVSVVIWVWVGLAVLTYLGVNVTPVVASAGVVGVALGFGAQSLVKDFLSGIFMLIEDQYGVGDTIDVGDVVGTVEDVSLRLTTLRDIHGTQWFARNGEILRIGNFSQDYAVALINIPIALDENASDAINAVTDAVNAAAQEPAINDVLLDSPTVDGVNSIGLDHMLIRARVTTLPDQQWYVTRELTARILTALQQNNIDTPYPEGIAASRRASD